MDEEMVLVITFGSKDVSRKMVERSIHYDMNCHLCKEPTSVVIAGPIASCYYCGGEFRLCEAHFEEFKRLVNG